jgi:hypothetical protein
MTPEKWEQIVGEIKDKFQVESHEKEHLEDEGGTDVEIIVFQGPLGEMKLEFITKPQVIDKKTNYSSRIGSDTNVQYVYSETEKSSQLHAYKWNNDDQNWVEIDAASFF